MKKWSIRFSVKSGRYWGYPVKIRGNMVNKKIEHEGFKNLHALRKSRSTNICSFRKHQKSLSFLKTALWK